MVTSILDAFFCILCIFVIHISCLHLQYLDIFLLCCLAFFGQSTLSNGSEKSIIDTPCFISALKIRLASPSFSSVFCYSLDLITLFLPIHHLDTFFFMIVVTPWCKIVAPSWSAILMTVVLFAIQYPSLLLGSSRHSGRRNEKWFIIQVYCFQCRNRLTKLHFWYQSSVQIYTFNQL